MTLLVLLVVCIGDAAAVGLQLVACEAREPMSRCWFRARYWLCAKLLDLSKAVAK